jgi:uncharacterized protein
MRVLVAGASGMIGSALCTRLARAGHDVTRLVRREPTSRDERNWSPSAGMIDFRLMDETDAVVNLSGASLSRLPWTRRYREQILQSRLSSTRTLTDAMGKADSPPAVFLSGSAVGIYGDRPGLILDEGSIRGSGFLADVVEAWEGAAAVVPEGVRVVTLRTGLVVGPGGALGPVLPLTKLGAGANLGTGTQFWPWISLADEVRAIEHLLGSDLAGPVNLAGPVPATADALLRTVASELHRPYLFRVPARLIELVLGDAGRELLLASQRVSAKLLLDDGFAFEHETVDVAVRWLLRGKGAL